MDAANDGSDVMRDLLRDISWRRAILTVVAGALIFAGMLAFTENAMQRDQSYMLDSGGW